MNKLYLLLKDFCPNGVEYQELAHAVSIERGKRVVREQLDETGLYPVYQNSLTPLGYHSQWNYPAETTFLIVAGAAGEIGYSTCNFWAADDCFPLVCGENLSSRYLYHVMLWLQPTILSRVRKASIPRLSRDSIERLTIPLPPLEVQHEIVRILDTFTELTSELTENLSRELTARKHQYTYYRNKLLEKNTKAMKMKLGDIFDFQNGFAFKSRLFKESGNAILRIVNIKANQISTDNLVFFDEADYKENLSPYIVRQNDIVIAMSGATTGKIGVNVTPFNFYLNQRVGKFIPKENIVLSRYLYHLLLQMSEEIHAISEGGAQPNLSSEKLKKLTAYIPPISEQKRIVKVLDTFAYLCTDLTSGLPAEIEARQKQYEYYRDKLLSFTPAD